MKKFFAFAMIAALALTPASAQGLLKDLGNKALNAAKEKVGEKVSETVSEKTGIKMDKSKSSGSDSSSSVAVDESYVTNLTASNEDWKPASVIEGEEGYEPSISFATYSAAIAAMPALPSAADICTAEGKEAYAKKVLDYDLAVELMAAEYLSAVGQFTNTTASAIGAVDAALSSDEMAAAMEVAEEWAKLPEAEQNKIEAMAEKDENAARAYCKTNHPALYKKMMAMPTDSKMQKKADEVNDIIDQEKADRYSAVGDKLSDIQTKKTEELSAYLTESVKAAAKAALTGKDVVMGANPTETALMTARNEIVKAWAKSAEAKQVLKMEEELNKKVNAWMKQNKKGWNDELPAFWAEGRKAQNEVIDKFNAAQAEKWIECISKSIETQKEGVSEIVALDDELEAIRNGAEGDMVYWQNKMYSGMLSMTVSNYLLLHTMAFEMPLVQHVPEVNIQ